MEESSLKHHGDGSSSHSSSLFSNGSAGDSVFDMGPTPDETALWLGDSEADAGFLGSLESGGALMTNGSWSISTLPGDEGLRWSGVKAEVYDNWAVQTAKQADSRDKCPSTLVPQTIKSIPMPRPTSGLHGMVKMEENWMQTLPPVIGSGPLGPTRVHSSTELASSFNQPTCVMDTGGEPPPATRVSASAKDKTRTSAKAAAAPRLPASTPAKQRPASRGATAAVSGTRKSATTAASIVKTEVVEDDEEDIDEADDDDAIGNRDSGDELDPGSELSDKRRRNREHAKRSRMRKRVRLGGLEEMVLGLRRENVRLRQIVQQGIPEHAPQILRACASDNTNPDIVAKQDVVQGMRPGMSVSSSSSTWSGSGGGARSRLKQLQSGSNHRNSTSSGSGSGSSAKKDGRVPSALKLMSPCFQSVKALAESQANFVLTNPNLADCPIIFASQGFLELTGYDGSQVIGKNCRFLQGRGTDARTVSIIRNNLAGGRDTSVCILNYKANGTPFWNQLSIGVLLDAHGQVANHVGVMCEVNQMPPSVFHRLLHRVPLPESLLQDDGCDSTDEAVASSKAIVVGARHSGPRSSSSVSAGVKAPTSPRVVDRLRRTRAAAATDSAPSQN